MTSHLSRRQINTLLAGLGVSLAASGTASAATPSSSRASRSESDQLAALYQKARKENGTLTV